jgi:hypothetical protein
VLGAVSSSTFMGTSWALHWQTFSPSDVGDKLGLSWELLEVTG